MIIFMFGSNECMLQIYKCMLLSSEVTEKKRPDRQKKSLT